MLADNGGLAEADALLEAAARLPPVDADEGYSIARFLTRRATLKAQAGDVVGALEVLDAGLQRFGIDGTYCANFVANASALLAETGRYAEALALLDRLPRPKGKSLKIGETFVNADGAIQLTWIRACALRGLGQAGAANAELNRFLANAYATDNVRARALTCFGDVDRLTRFFVTALEGAAGQRVLLRLQPGYTYRTDQSRTAIAAVRADETVALRFAETQRVLPDELVVLLSERRS